MSEVERPWIDDADLEGNYRFAAIAAGQKFPFNRPLCEHQRPPELDLTAYRLGAVSAAVSLGCVSSPHHQRTAPDAAMESATNQKAASTWPLKWAVSPSPSAPMP